jgi:hypothetical protein
VPEFVGLYQELSVHLHLFLVPRSKYVHVSAKTVSSYVSTYAVKIEARASLPVKGHVCVVVVVALPKSLPGSQVLDVEHC